jgi:hypothetical protein
MTDSIKDFDDSDLLQVYEINAKQISIAKRKPDIYGTKIREFIQDQREIEKEIDGRMSIDFMCDLDLMRSGQPASQVIHPGDVYRHRMLPLLRLQVVDEHDFRGPFFSVRCFISRTYACRFIVKGSTIMEHFTKTTEV